MNTPQSYKLTYLLDEVKKTFAQYKKTTQEKPLLSDLIRIEPNNGYNAIKVTNELLRVRDTDVWRKCSITGLRPTKIDNYYYGDLQIQSVKSLCIIHYPKHQNKIEIRVFPQYYPYQVGMLHKIVETALKHF